MFSGSRVASLFIDDVDIVLCGAFEFRIFSLVLGTLLNNESVLCFSLYPLCKGRTVLTVVITSLLGSLHERISDMNV